jgi:hypothetical protein
MKRKPTEFAVNSYASMMTVTQYDDLDLLKEYNPFDQNNPCHIYAICRRPRFRIVKDKFECNGESLKMDFKIQYQDDFSDLELEIQNPFGNEKVEIESEYPYSTFHFVTERGKIKAKTASFLHGLPRHTYNGDFLDLEVLYIGQSYGVEGARTAPERLKKHETLQAIYAEALGKNPDQEIWLMLFSFSQLGLTMFDGRTKFSEEEREQDKGRATEFFHKFATGGLTEQQFINFTEAALIRYFKPRYNKDYVNIFPNPAHTTYTECYDLDINSVAIELGTMDSVNIMLYSESVKREIIHFGQFLLHDKKERMSMFDFSEI